ncbi:hypothetical protein LR69_04451 [Geobacillus sp. BCO2]|nr:hypothetical protein LR69_04451 [Geobacillus sp. BCO2]
MSRQGWKSERWKKRRGGRRLFRSSKNRPYGRFFIELMSCSFYVTDKLGQSFVNSCHGSAKQFFQIVAFDF